MARPRAARSALSPLSSCLVLAALAGCAPGGSDPGGGAASSASRSVPGALRLVGLDRRLLSPSASPRLALVVERPAGLDPRALVLEESPDGVTYAPTGAAPAAASAAAFWDLPLPGAPRFFRVAAPVRSNTVRVLPAAAVSAGTPDPALSSPPPGARGVPRAPLFAAFGGPPAGSYLFAVADEEGTLVWLAESPGGTLSPGATGATEFIPAARLPGGAPLVAAVLALDGDAFAVAATARADFVTAP